MGWSRGKHSADVPSGLNPETGELEYSKVNGLHSDERADANLKSAQTQLEWEMEMYRNNYNSYVNDLQRWKDAGLNPHFYGGVQGDGSANTAEAASSDIDFRADEAAVENLISSGNFFADSLSKAYNMQIQRQQLDNDYQRLKLESEQLGLERQRVNNETRMADSSVTKSDQEVRNLQKDYELLQSTIEKQVSEKNFTDKQLEEFKNQMIRNAELHEDVRKDYAKKLEVSEAQIKEMESVIADNMMSAKLKDAQSVGQYLHNVIEDQFGLRRSSAEIDKLISDVATNLVGNDSFAMWFQDPSRQAFFGQGEKRLNDYPRASSLPGYGISVPLPSTANYNGFQFTPRLNGNFGNYNSRVFGR